jgi:adenylate kinase
MNINCDFNFNSVDIPLPNILITGTPGVGKTSLAMLLTDNLNEKLSNTNKRYTYINIGKLITDKKLYTDWNKDFDVPEFDEDKVLDEIEPMIKSGGLILDFHSAFFFPDEWIQFVVLLRCDNTILYDRLKSRGYSDKKIKENIECEIMEVTSEDVKENFSQEKIIEIKSEKIEDMENNITLIIEKLNILSC